MAWTRGREIGKGSTAAVSVATHGDFSGEILAVKSTEFSKSQFLQREKEILSALSCPHVVGYKGFDISKESNELYYNLFMEYVPEGTLSDEIRRRGGRMDEEAIRAYACQILKAAEYLHSNGVSHCDIKGSNILISEEHGAKLADFGCSKRAGDCQSNGAVSISGTPVYMAPETARGEEQGSKADIWAIGCTVIEMATGGPAWPDCGSDPARILYRIAFSDTIPAFPSSLSEQGKDFLSKCLVRDRSLRWTATELLTHPFVTKLESFPKPISNSPTSILDHQLWNASDDESASHTQTEMEAGTSGDSQDEDRIEQLASVSGRPDWGSDEDWVPVRWENGSISQSRDSCFSSKLGDGGCCVDVEVDDGGFVVGDFSIDFGRFCRYAADPSVSSLIISC